MKLPLKRVAVLALIPSTLACAASAPPTSRSVIGERTVGFSERAAEAPSPHEPRTLPPATTAAVRRELADALTRHGCQVVGGARSDLEVELEGATRSDAFRSAGGIEWSTHVETDDLVVVTVRDRASGRTVWTGLANERETGTLGESLTAGCGVATTRGP